MRIKEIIEDFESSSNYCFIRRDRADSRRGGGVAICFDHTKVQFSQARTPDTGHEIVAAIGRRRGQRRKILVIGVYLPPSYDADRSNECLACVNDIVQLLTARYNDPYVVVAGDFNKRNFRKATRDFPLIKPIVTPPTRGHNVLDIIATNFGDLVVDSGVCAPIRTDQEGIESDHLVVHAKVRMPRVPQYEVESYQYHRFDEQGRKKFGEWLRKADWESIYRHNTPTEKVRELHNVFSKATNECFELKTRKKKTSEPPWMTDAIRDAIRRRRAIYRREKRQSEAWRKMKAETSKIVRERRNNFNKELKEKFMAADSARGFYQCINVLLNGNNKRKWNVRSLYPGKNDNEIAEELALFFNGISMEYEPLSREGIPKTAFPNPLLILNVTEVANRLKANKKPRSQVPGDINPLLYNE